MEQQGIKQTKQCVALKDMLGKPFKKAKVINLLMLLIEQVKSRHRN